MVGGSGRVGRGEAGGGGVGGGGGDSASGSVGAESSISSSWGGMRSGATWAFGGGEFLSIFYVLCFYEVYYVSFFLFVVICFFNFPMCMFIYL